jgi:CheY-like chemotaxis protein
MMNVSVKALIVDDDPFVRKTIKLMLNTIGQFDIVEAGDGATALKLIESFRPEIVLCDIGMEPMSGIDLLKYVRKLNDTAMRDVAFIMLTGNAEERMVLQAQALGISGYLVKPVSPQRLRTRLESVLATQRV